MNKLAFLALPFIAGCATHTDVLRDGPRQVFESTKAPMKLAVCIDRNADTYALGSLQSKIIDPTAQPIEIVIRNGAMIDSIVHVNARATGSSALFHFGGVASTFPESSLKAMTKGCA